jgi:hypothetical protein
MLETVALCLGYAVMTVGGVAIAIAIAWLCVEYWWRRWGDFKLLHEFRVWRRDKDRIPG